MARNLYIVSRPLATPKKKMYQSSFLHVTERFPEGGVTRLIG
jgi:hypothetical protein